MKKDARLYKAVRNTVLGIFVFGILVWAGIGAVGALDSDPGVFSSIESEPLNESAVEDVVQEQINDERVAADLIVLESERQLENEADDHTKRMAENGILSHQIGESSAHDRLGAAGCGFGSENVAQTHAYEDVKIGDEVYETDSEEALAKALVATWMDSEPHRQNILTTEFRKTGIAVEITESGDVYATQMFCE